VFVSCFFVKLQKIRKETRAYHFEKTIIGDDCGYGDFGYLQLGTNIAKVRFSIRSKENQGNVKKLTFFFFQNDE